MMSDYYAEELSMEERGDLPLLATGLCNQGLSPDGVTRFKLLFEKAMSRLSELEYVVSRTPTLAVRLTSAGREAAKPHGERSVCRLCKYSQYLCLYLYRCEHKDHLTARFFDFISGKYGWGLTQLSEKFNDKGQCQKYEPITNRFLRWWRGS